MKSMTKPIARLDLRELRRRLRRIGSWRKSHFPEKVKLRLRIVSWYGRRRVEEICQFFQISKGWFYRLLHTFLREGLAGFMKRSGRPKGSTIPKGIIHRDDKMEFFHLVEFKSIKEGQGKLGLFDVWQNGCPNRGLDDQSPAEAYGRPISHQRCVEAFYQLYLGEAPPRI